VLSFTKNSNALNALVWLFAWCSVQSCSQDRKFRDWDQGQDQDRQCQYQDQLQETKKRSRVVSSGLETKTAVSRTTSLAQWVLLFNIYLIVQYLSYCSIFILLFNRQWMATECSAGIISSGQSAATFKWSFLSGPVLECLWLAAL